MIVTEPSLTGPPLPMDLQAPGVASLVLVCKILHVWTFSLSVFSISSLLSFHMFS